MNDILMVSSGGGGTLGLRFTWGSGGLMSGPGGWVWWVGGLVVAKKLAGSGGGLGRPPCLALPAPGSSLT